MRRAAAECGCWRLRTNSARRGSSGSARLCAARCGSACWVDTRADLRQLVRLRTRRLSAPVDLFMREEKREKDELTLHPAKQQKALANNDQSGVRRARSRALINLSQLLVSLLCACNIHGTQSASLAGAKMGNCSQDR